MKRSLLPNIFISEFPLLSSFPDKYRTHSPPMQISWICPMFISSSGLIKAANAPSLPLNLLDFLFSSNIFSPAQPGKKEIQQSKRGTKNPEKPLGAYRV